MPIEKLRQRRQRVVDELNATDDTEKREKLQSYLATIENEIVNQNKAARKAANNYELTGIIIVVLSILYILAMCVAMSSTQHTIIANNSQNAVVHAIADLSIWIVGLTFCVFYGNVIALFRR